ncbi:MAG: hypothetical protein ACRDRH_19635 [Pseudonocardia sp.]
MITLAQAVGCGMSARTVQRRVREGSWERLFPATYLVGGHRLTDEARIRAVWLWAGGEPAAVTGRRPIGLSIGCGRLRGGCVVDGSADRLDQRLRSIRDAGVAHGPQPLISARSPGSSSCRGGRSRLRPRSTSSPGCCGGGRGISSTP